MDDLVDSVLDKINDSPSTAKTKKGKINDFEMRKLNKEITMAGKKNAEKKRKLLGKLQELLAKVPVLPSSLPTLFPSFPFFFLTSYFLSFLVSFLSSFFHFSDFH